MRAAAALEIPILATAEDIPRNGPLVSELATLLPPGKPAFNKMVFGLYDQDDIRNATRTLGRDQFVLTGLESDVCVTHSALGLLGATAAKQLLPMQPGDVAESFADIEPARRDLGFEPKATIETGLTRFVQWYKEYHGAN